jgi:alanyl-tRNA synthetase
MNTLNHIRKTFIDYFIKHGHTHVKASSLIPNNDPSLMFINSGMVQFKNVFTNLEQREYSRATSSQKSVRAGGKHNDLENVGYTARHHTFFEMLGNFSFGDYFKEEAIFYSWDLLTKGFQIPKEKLYVTIFYDDEESYNFWKKIAGLEDSRIIRINTTDNFWSMGPTGPCGPCSEIFYDHGENIKGGLPGTPEEDGDRFVEIWNIVFMQYEQINEDTRINLPNKSIDTGMGLERISAVLQGVHNNYDIDLFKELIGEAESIIKTPNIGESVFSYRVIADHIRACAFLISDGLMPSNEGRGYVLRRIMRRAVNHAHQLGAKEPVMYKLLHKLIKLMGEAYPELERAKDFTSSILQQEEERFKITLDKGLKLLNEEMADIKDNQLSGKVAFKLYDTYGFPLDLTQNILAAKNIKIDHAEFDKEMKLQKEMAKKSWKGSGDNKESDIWFDLYEKFGSTEFFGYSHENLEGKITALICSDKLEHKINITGKEFILLSNQTPFYGESGGQIGDRGIITGSGFSAKIVNTRKYLGKIIAHICVLESGEVKTGDEILLKIDSKFRQELRNNHTCTHILHAILRKKLGEHVTQKGSLVSSEKLRFDINHISPISKDMLQEIEDEVNEIILADYEVQTVLMTSEKAIEEGAMALFGEKYDEEVRVVSIIGLDGKEKYSIELCGGTHVFRTGQIGLFKIISESSIAAGIRRIEGITGQYVINYLREKDEIICSIAEKLKISENEILEKISLLNEQKHNLEIELNNMLINSLVIPKEEIEIKSINVNNIKIFIKLLKNVNIHNIRSSLEITQASSERLIIIYLIDNDGKNSLILSVSKDIAKDLDSVGLVKKISIELGGKGTGGGNNLFAQTGGFPELNIERVKETVIACLGLKETL